MLCGEEVKKGYGSTLGPLDLPGSSWWYQCILAPSATLAVTSFLNSTSQITTSRASSHSHLCHIPLLHGIMPHPFPLGAWYLNGTTLYPRPCHRKARLAHFAKLQNDPVISLNFPDGNQLVVHHSRLIGELTSLIDTWPTTQTSIPMTDSYSTFKLIYKFLNLDPVQLFQFPADLPFLADKWRLSTLYEACFAIAEVEAGDLFYLCRKWMPVMAHLPLPKRFKNYFALRFALGIPVCGGEVWLASTGCRGCWRHLTPDGFALRHNVLRAQRDVHSGDACIAKGCVIGECGVNGVDSVWHVFVSQGMMEQVIEYMERFRDDCFNLISDVVLTIAAPKMKDCDVLAILEELDAESKAMFDALLSKNGGHDESRLLLRARIDPDPDVCADFEVCKQYVVPQLKSGVREASGGRYEHVLERDEVGGDFNIALVCLNTESYTKLSRLVLCVGLCDSLLNRMERIFGEGESKCAADAMEKMKTCGARIRVDYVENGCACDMSAVGPVSMDEALIVGSTSYWPTSIFQNMAPLKDLMKDGASVFLMMGEDFRAWLEAHEDGCGLVLRIRFQVCRQLEEDKEKEDDTRMGVYEVETEVARHGDECLCEENGFDEHSLRDDSSFDSTETSGEASAVAEAVGAVEVVDVVDGDEGNDAGANADANAIANTDDEVDGGGGDGEEGGEEGGDEGGDGIIPNGEAANGGDHT